MAAEFGSDHPSTLAGAIISPVVTEESSSTQVRPPEAGLTTRPVLIDVMRRLSEVEMAIVRKYGSGSEPPMGNHEANQCPNCIDNGNAFVH